MPPLYTLSLVPVIAVALLLAFSALLHARQARGLAMYCFAVAFWAWALLLLSFPSVAEFGRRLAASGAICAAAYIHAAYDFTRQKHYRMVWFAYAVAVGIMLVGVFLPGALYDPISFREGPYYWHFVAVAVVGLSIPLDRLATAFKNVEEIRHTQFAALFAAGVFCMLGIWINAALLVNGVRNPYGMFLVLGSLLLMGHVVRGHMDNRARRLLQRTLSYAAVTAFLSATFLFVVMALMVKTGRTGIRGYGFSSFLLLAMALLAFEPLRQYVMERLGRRIAPDTAAAGDLARELAVVEERADQAERLAELGTVASAVAHEVRNPLGVLSAHLRILERGGADADTVDSMRAQIDRAGRFVDDLLRYGRPRPLELRLVDLGATLALAQSTALSGLPFQSGATWTLSPEEGPTVEADQSQLLQVLVILFENSLLALQGAEAPELRAAVTSAGDQLTVVVEDSGPGLPDAIADRVFEPFVTSRKREQQSGTGLGLAIARSIVERHGGTISAGKSPLGGARFALTLPRYQPVLAAATGSPS